jgi:diguanylate cyclase
MLGVFSKIAQRKSPRKAAVPLSPESEEQAEAALALVRELLHAVEQFVISTPDLDSSRFLHRIRGTAAQLTTDAEAANIEVYRQWLANALRAFGSLQKSYVSEREAEMWRLLDAYSRTSDTTSYREHQLVTMIQGAHDRMRELVTLDDIRTARTELEAEIQQVQRAVHLKAQEDKERATALGREVARLESTLAAARGQANFDVLTGVYHRAIVDDRLRALLRDGKPVCFALMDIDNFRTINASLGHAVGDRVLAILGEQLQRISRTTDLAARYGGDEFCFLAVGGTPEQLAQRIAGAVARRHVRLEIEDRTCSVLLSVSVGITGSSPGDTHDEILERAGRALAVVKASGKGGIRLAQS